MRSKRSLWPVDSGDSKAGFYTEVEEDGSIGVYNREPYARVIEFRKHYRDGSPNPHYRAARRTIDKHLGDLVEAEAEG